MILPFWTSFLIRVYAWIGILRPDGLLDMALMGVGLISEPLQIINTNLAVQLGLFYSYLPFMVLPIYAAVERYSFAYSEAAADLYGLTVEDVEVTVGDTPGTKVEGTALKYTGNEQSAPVGVAFIRQNQVDEVVIVGLDAAYCINATIQGALNRGYRVTVVPEGIATESRKPVASYLEHWRRAGADVQAAQSL